jgi:hypothetical protein
VWVVVLHLAWSVGAAGARAALMPRGLTHPLAPVDARESVNGSATYKISDFLDFRISGKSDFALSSASAEIADPAFAEDASDGRPGGARLHQGDIVVLGRDLGVGQVKFPSKSRLD